MKKVAILAMLLGLTTALPAPAKEVAGVSLPETTTVDGKTLKLNGAGLRKKVVFKVYVAGLYLETPSKDAVNGLKTLQQLWLEALAGLTWKAGESDEDYKNRVSRPYVAFVEWSDAIRKAVATAPKAPAGAASKAKAPAGTASKSKAPAN